MRWKVIAYQASGQFPNFHRYINSGLSRRSKAYGETMNLTKLFKTHIKNPGDIVRIYSCCNSDNYASPISMKNVLKKLQRFHNDYDIGIQALYPNIKCVVIGYKTKTQELLGKI